MSEPTRDELRQAAERVANADVLQGIFLSEAQLLARHVLATLDGGTVNERLLAACRPFALLGSTVDFSKWDTESEIEILTPSTRHTRGSHRLTLQEIINLRAAIAAAEAEKAE